MIVRLIQLFVLIITLHQLLYWIYFWQLKEYRLDRAKAATATSYDLWSVLIRQFDLTRWFRPKITLRAILALCLGTAVVFVAVLMNSWVAVSFILFQPLVSALCLVIVAPIFIWWKKIVIFRAREKMKSFRGVVIGITGSYGKSSTKDLLAHVLASKYKVAKTLGNNNSEIGVAKTVLKRLYGDEDYFVVEMGAYRPGEIKAICDIVHPHVGIITGIGDQHLDMFGSLENIRKAKHELIGALPTDGLRMVAEKDFDLSEAKDIHVQTDGVEFNYSGQKFTAHVLGKSLVRNIIAVIKVCQQQGMSLAEIAKAIMSADAKIFQPHLIKSRKGATIVNNSYNSSLESFLSVLDYLQIWKGYRKTVVTPGMMELGGNASKDHLVVGKKLGESADKIYVTDQSHFNELNVSNKAVLEKDYRRLLSALEKENNSRTVILFQNRIPAFVLESLKNHD